MIFHVDSCLQLLVTSSARWMLWPTCKGPCPISPLCWTSKTEQNPGFLFTPTCSRLTRVLSTFLLQVPGWHNFAEDNLITQVKQSWKTCEAPTTGDKGRIVPGLTKQGTCRTGATSTNGSWDCPNQKGRLLVTRSY